jgi:flavin reductase (DIM6/NTAB) family NADH-FMN oxidoreductase RutF
MKTEIGAFEAVAETMDALSGAGCLLLAGSETVNPMTIGWAQIGVVWSRPVMSVLVRPSRFTYGLMMEAGTFSVNVPDSSLRKACAVCGSKSGRDIEKMKECGLTAEKGLALEVPTLAECPVHYECRIVHRNDVDPGTLDAGVKSSAYGGGDFHTVWWGEIAGVFRRS